MNTVVSSAPASMALSTPGGDATARTPRQRSEGARGLAALLLAALVAAMVVVADQVIDSWVDGHVFLAWVLLWAVVFAVTLVFAGTARRMGQRAMAALNRWSQAAAVRRAEARMWEIAKTDPRVMNELVAAQQRADVTVSVAPAVPDIESLMRLGRSQMPAGRRRAVFYC